MSKENAKKILDLALKQGAEQDAMLEELKTNCSDEEFEEYRGMASRILGSLLFEIINPIVKKYPDLKPKEMD
ncbi:hypothetical protein V6C03_00050 [Methyloligella sp. 2.7D]|uniref:hypothetical protein n=1 Tax=unclassified Methyloligella TaxID=2625955 RepID=UPI00157D19E2|nr:hypothetical protein [Methyloligella sp. GL2]QKP76930.1 hypothetical protein HT051_05360 [Methyloligella sp. GL2]